MSSEKTETPLDKANRVIAENKKERVIKAAEEINKICKDYNVRIEQVVVIDNKNVPVNALLALPIGLTIVAL